MTKDAKAKAAEADVDGEELTNDQLEKVAGGIQATPSVGNVGLTSGVTIQPVGVTIQPGDFGVKH